MAAESLVRVVGLGLDARFRSMLDVFFLRSCNGSYQFAEDAADVIVVDMDTVGARDAYVEHRQSNEGVPSILFSLHEENYKTRGNVVLLRKPFTVRQLQSAFEIISLRFLSAQGENAVTSVSRIRKLSTTRAGSKSQRDKKDKKIEQKEPNELEAGSVENSAIARQPVPGIKREPAGTSRAAFSLARHDEYVKLNSLLPGMAGGDFAKEAQTYEPNNYLQHELKLAREQALKAGKNAVIKIGSATITVDPEQGLVQMRVGKFQLREVSSFPLNHNNFEVRLVPEKEAQVDRAGKSKVLKLPELIWQTTLYAAQGRVPAGFDLDEQVQLSRWPNLTRLMLTSGAVRMSALWVMRPASVSEIATKLELSIRDVSSFYSAAQALDLYFSDDEVREPELKPEPESRPGGILRRILQRLRA